MLINNGDNTGQQFNFEGKVIINGFENNDEYYNVEHLCDAKPMFSMRKITVAGIISLFADIASIFGVYLTYKTSHINNIFTYISSNQILYFVLILLIAVTCLVWGSIYKLISAKKLGEFVRDKKQVKLIIPKRCPKCGERTNAYLKLKNVDGDDYFVCTLNPDHKWKFDFTDLL